MSPALEALVNAALMATLVLHRTWAQVGPDGVGHDLETAAFAATSTLEPRLEC